MENASKALLIAAGILIVILLIAMGMRIFNSTRGTTDSLEGTMVTAEVSMFNRQIENYMGGNKNYNQFIDLLSRLIVINAQQQDEDKKVKIDFRGKGTNIQGPEAILSYAKNHEDPTDTKCMINKIFKFEVQNTPSNPQKHGRDSTGRIIKVAITYK